METTRFTVAMPVYNKARHVARSIESIFGQTLPPLEIIAVDDNSTDASAQIVREVGGDRVLLLHRAEPGPGGYAARNLAIENASGEWIAFLDADDAWEPNHISVLDRVIRDAGPEVGCVFTGYQRLEPDGRREKDWYSAEGQPAGRRTSAELLADWLRKGCPMWMGAVAVRRDVLQRAGMFPAGKCRRGGDRVLWLQVLLRTTCAYAGEITATYYRDADDMITRREPFSTAYLRQVIASEIGAYDAATDRLLKRMLNTETYDHVYWSWRRGLPLSPADGVGLSIGDDPIRYALIKLMIALPLNLPPWLRNAIRRLRA